MMTRRKYAPQSPLVAATGTTMWPAWFIIIEQSGAIREDSSDLCRAQVTAVVDSQPRTWRRHLFAHDRDVSPKLP